MDTNIPTQTRMKEDSFMIDLSLDYHAHILPGCDHGSSSVAMSLKQINMAKAAVIIYHKTEANCWQLMGTDSRRCTPHSARSWGVDLWRNGAPEWSSWTLSWGNEWAFAGDAILSLAWIDLGYFVSTERSAWNTNRDCSCRSVFAGGHPSIDFRGDPFTVECRMPSEIFASETLSWMDSKRVCFLSRQWYSWTWAGLLWLW